MNNDNMYIIYNRDYCMHRGKQGIPFYCKHGNGGIKIGEEGTCLSYEEGHITGRKSLEKYIKEIVRIERDHD